MADTDGSDSTRTVAVDTSALMTPVQHDVRLFDELDRLLGEYMPVVPRAVLVELDRLSSGEGAEATAARVGRDLADRCRTVETEASRADDALVELARTGRVEYVVTNDRPLGDRVRSADAGVIGLRGRNKLERTQP